MRWYVVALVLAVGLILYGVLAFDIEEAFGADPIDAGVEAIKEAEGFRGQSYTDTAGNPTIGYGTKLPLTKAEGELLLRHRLGGDLQCFIHGWSPWKAASMAEKAALVDAVYALGCAGLLGFHDALTALASGDTAAGAAGLRDSVWYKEEPHRVDQVIDALTKE